MCGQDRGAGTMGNEPCVFCAAGRIQVGAACAAERNQAAASSWARQGICVAYLPPEQSISAPVM